MNNSAAVEESSEAGCLVGIYTFFILLNWSQLFDINILFFKRLTLASGSDVWLMRDNSADNTTTHRKSRYKQLHHLFFLLIFIKEDRHREGQTL
jgi:hypothetical protein